MFKSDKTLRTCALISRASHDRSVPTGAWTRSDRYILRGDRYIRTFGYDDVAPNPIYGSDWAFIYTYMFVLLAWRGTPGHVFPLVILGFA